MTLGLLRSTSRYDPGPWASAKQFSGVGKPNFWTWQNTISTLFIPNFLFKLAIVYLKFHKCQTPGPGHCPLVPTPMPWTQMHFRYFVLKVYREIICKHLEKNFDFILCLCGIQEWWSSLRRGQGFRFIKRAPLA